MDVKGAWLAIGMTTGTGPFGFMKNSSGAQYNFDPADIVTSEVAGHKFEIRVRHVGANDYFEVVDTTTGAPWPFKDGSGGWWGWHLDARALRRRLRRASKKGLKGIRWRNFQNGFGFVS